MYTQKVTPNLDPYLYQNGKMLTNWVGYCILYARTAFGTPPAGASATDAYNSTKFKHTDALPSGVYVPVWFSWTGTVNGVRKNWGHVAIYKDGTCWSSPFSKKAVAEKYTIAQIEAKMGAKYLGWSEDIGGVRVVENVTGGDMPTLTTKEDLDYLYADVLKRQRGAGEGEDVHLNKDYRVVHRNIRNSAEAKAVNEAMNSKDRVIADLQTALANEQKKPPKEIVREVEKVIVEYKDREVIKEVEVEPKWLSRVRDAVLTFLKIKRG